MLNFQKVNDLLFDEFAVLNFLFGGFPNLERAAGNTGFHMDMPAKADIVQNGHAPEYLDLLKGSGHTQFGALVRPDVVDSLPFINDTALLRAVKTVDTIHHHGFTGPVGSDD